MYLVYIGIKILCNLIIFINLLENEVVVILSEMEISNKMLTESQNILINLHFRKLAKY